MQIVDPNAHKPKKRQPKSNARTPQEYLGAWHTMGEGLFSPQYYVRAKDPGDIYVKRMKEALKWNKERTQEAEARAVVYSEGGRAGRKTFGAKFMTQSECLGIPTGSSEGDLYNILEASAKLKRENTLNTFSQRLQMLLGMLGDVTVETEQELFWKPGVVKILSVKGHRFQLKLLN